MVNCNSYQKESVQLSSNLGIAKVSNMINPEVVNKEVSTKVNHVFCVDISGSMWRELKSIRTQLKARLSEIVSNDDTITLIYFADGKDVGIVKEFAQLKTKDDILELNKLIDKYIVSKGCTDFVKPLELTGTLIDKAKSKAGELFNFIFMSDGGHNMSSFDEVRKIMDSIKEGISTCTIIEYGMYADTDRLQEMAETLGGSKIFDEDFEDYEVDVELALKSKTSPRVSFNIADFKSDMRLQLMFAIDQQTNSVKVFSTDRVDEIFIPTNTTELYYVTKTKGKVEDFSLKGISPQLYGAIYAAIYVFSSKMKYNIVEELLYSSRDKELIDLYCNSFGKQKLVEFQNVVLNRIFSPKDNIELTTAKYRPNPKKYCVLDFMNDIMSDEDNKIYLFHEDFNYSRTGAKAVVKKILTDEQKEKLSKVSTKLKADKILAEADENSPEMIIKDKSAGYSVNKLQWNKERANLSLQVSIDVDVKLPKTAKMFKEGTVIPSYIIRNYTLIKDGILNVTQLPISLNNKLAGKFKRMGLVKSEKDGIYTIDISSLPIINKKSTESVTSIDMSKLELESLENQACLKYLNYLKTGLIDANKSTKINSSNLVDKKYSEEQLEYLNNIGLTSKGYSPKTELDYTGDFYMANSLKTLVEKFSSLPKIENIMDKNKNNKQLTASEAYVFEIMKNIDSKVKVASDKYERVCELIGEHKKISDFLNREIAQNKFSIILSRKWFIDKTDFDDNTVSVNINGAEHKITWSYRDVKVNL